MVDGLSRTVRLDLSQRSSREESRFAFEKVVYFVDSLIVLAWIHTQARSFKTFVSTQIKEIQSSSDPTEWRHILCLEAYQYKVYSRGESADPNSSGVQKKNGLKLRQQRIRIK